MDNITMSTRNNFTKPILAESASSNIKTARERKIGEQKKTKKVLIEQIKDAD
jgi:hypothetical protein